MAKYSFVNGKGRDIVPSNNRDEVPFREALRILARIVADKHLSKFDDSVDSLIDENSTDSSERKESRQSKDGKEG